MNALLDLLFDISSTIQNVSDENAFCSSSMHSHSTVLQAGSDGMIMYMGGFRFSLSGNQPCLNLYLPGWTLDTRAKFLWAMIGIILLGIVMEGISKLRAHLSKRLSGLTKRLTITLVHVVQALVGYILMLATMTFSVELLGCVILGLGFGFALFYDDEDVYVMNNPCCNFIQNQTNERVSALRRRNSEQEEDAEDYNLMASDSPLAAQCNDEDGTRV